MAYKKSSPAKKKKQGYNARLDDSLGAKHGKKKQSMKDRRDESEGMEKSKGRKKFSGNKSSAQGKKDPKKNVTRVKTPMDIDIDVSPGKGKRKGSPAKQIDPPKKQKAKGTLVKSTKRQKISGSKDSASPKRGNYLTKEVKDARTGKLVSSSTKPARTKKITEAQYNNEPSYKSVHAKAAREKGYMMNYNTGQFEPTPNKKGKERRAAANLKSPLDMSGRAYDMKQAYNKDLTDKARLHYLENERHDADSPAKMYHKKSPMNMSRDLTYGGPVIDQEPKALSHMGASKVLRHMHGSKHSPLNMNGGPGKPKAKMPQGDTIRGFDKYNVGDYVSEDDFEAKFKKKGNNPKNYPQLSVQDYSRVKQDKKGKYVNKLKD